MKFAIAVLSHVVWPSCRGSRNSNALSAARRCAGGIQEVETRAIWPCDLLLDLVPDGGGGFGVLEMRLAHFPVDLLYLIWYNSSCSA